MKNKRILILCAAAILTCGNTSNNFCYGNEDKNFTQTEEEAKTGIKYLLRKKFSVPEYLFWYVYDDNQSEKDAKNIYEIIEKKCINNASNFKSVPVYVKKWSKERTQSDAELKIEDGLRELIYERIKQIDSAFLIEKIRITNNIISQYRGRNEKQFIGDKLTQKIRNEMTKIRNEQKRIEQQTQAKNSVQIKKYFTSKDCPICMENFGDIGKRIYLAPCGHNICPVCFDKYKEKCALCRGKVKGYKKEKVQPEYNPEYNR